MCNKVEEVVVMVVAVPQQFYIDLRGLDMEFSNASNAMHLIPQLVGDDYFLKTLCYSEAEIAVNGCKCCDICILSCKCMSCRK